MSDKYKMKDILETMIDNNEPHWSTDTIDAAQRELDRLYIRDFKADEIKTINGILLGEMDTLKINLNYYKKQAAKADEYEAKAKAFDEIIHAINSSSNPGQNGSPYIDAIDFTIKAEYIVRKCESECESND